MTWGWFNYVFECKGGLTKIIKGFFGWFLKEGQMVLCPKKMEIFVICFLMDFGVHMDK